MKKNTISKIVDVLADPTDFRAIAFYGVLMVVSFYIDAMYYGWDNLYFGLLK